MFQINLIRRQKLFQHSVMCCIVDDLMKSSIDVEHFVDIVFQKQRLRISINMKFSEINDPNGICKDITGLGRWGNGDVELFMEHQDELDQIMEIVKQSFDAQAE